MSIYASSFALSDDEEWEANGRAPLVFQGSHVLPHDDDARAGCLDLAYIPGHIERPDRPAVDPDSEVLHPWLRLGLSTLGETGDLPHLTVVIDRQQVTALHAYLGDWLQRAAGAPEPVHVIDLRADGWTLMHPLACRPNLFDCQVQRRAQAVLEVDGIDAPLGRFVCDLRAEDGFAIGRPATDEDLMDGGVGG